MTRIIIKNLNEGDPYEIIGFSLMYKKGKLQQMQRIEKPKRRL